MINNNPTTLTEVQHNNLVGLLLGDGCLGIRKNSINPRLTIRRQISDLSYLQYHFNIFRNMCRDKAITIGKVYDKRYDKNYEYCNLETRHIPAFKTYKDKWYPNGKKIVPRDLVLNNEIIAIWICDDAYVRLKNNKNINITFNTQGFNIEDVEFLKSLLDEKYNTNFTIQIVKNNNPIILGHNHQSRLLLSDINKVFPTCMNRKSDVWKSIDLDEVLSPLSVSHDSSKIQMEFFNRIKNCSKFTLKNICLEMGWYYEYEYDYKTITVFTSIKNIVKKSIKNNLIVNISNTNSLSVNDELQWNGE